MGSQTSPANQVIPLSIKAIAEVSETNRNLTVSGTGWDAESVVNLTMYSEPTPLGGFHVDANGSFTVVVAIPDDKEPGNHTIRASGQRDGVVRTTDTFVELPGAVIRPAFPSASSAPTTGRTPSVLAFSGANTIPLVAIAGLAIAIGVFLVRLRRRGNDVV